MTCGLKWKTCSCALGKLRFNAVEEDRLNHMQVPEDGDEVCEQPVYERSRRDRRPRPPNNHNEEINERRHRERVEEILARRLQAVPLGYDYDDGHFSNERYEHATAPPNHALGYSQLFQERGMHPRAGEEPRMVAQHPVGYSGPRHLARYNYVKWASWSPAR
jgi:hypothetical protein